MPVGPGKYDELCTLIREKAEAEGAIVLVFGGNKGDGFSAQLPPWSTHKISTVIRHVAKQIDDAGGPFAPASAYKDPSPKPQADPPSTSEQMLGPDELKRLKEWTERVTTGQRDSAMFLSLFHPSMVENPSKDPVPVMQIGYAMLLDKPMLIVAPEGTPVPQNIRRAAMAVEFYDPKDLDTMKAATLRAIRASGVPGMDVIQ